MKICKIRHKAKFATLLLIAVCSAGQAQNKKAAPTAKPNVVLIYADDMGNADLSAYGNPMIKTPNIDGLARDGVKFTNAYTTAALCSPSRAGLLTGRYQQKFGFEGQISNGAYPNRPWTKQADGKWVEQVLDEAEFDRRGVPKSEANIAEIVKPHGYRTAAIGKWHLGHAPEFEPHNRGFDFSFMFYGNTSQKWMNIEDPKFVSKKVDGHDEMPLVAWTREGDNAIRQNGKIVEVEEYLDFRFRDEAIGFIERNKDQPFFMYLAINDMAPPLQVPRAYYDKLGDIKDENVRAYQALVMCYDDIIGSVLEKLKALGLEENTIVIFANDNGGALTRPGSNAPFSGGKFDTREGGIRTPLLIKWPARLAKGQVYDQPVSTLDILPTITGAAGIALPSTKQTDGVNLLPYLAKEKQGAPHDVLYWKLGNFQAVRKGKWKLYVDTAKNIAALYDLDSDPAEKTDLSKSKPEIFSELKSLYADWAKTLPPPAWPVIVDATH
jgi:arylsulfatase A-like enzyme